MKAHRDWMVIISVFVLYISCLFLQWDLGFSDSIDFFSFRFFFPDVISQTLFLSGTSLVLINSKTPRFLWVVAAALHALVNLSTIQDIIENGFHMKYLLDFNATSILVLFVLVVTGLFLSIYIRSYRTKEITLKDLCLFVFIYALGCLGLAGKLLLTPIFLLPPLISWAFATQKKPFLFMVFGVSILLMSVALFIEKNQESLEERQVLAVLWAQDQDFEVELKGSKILNNTQKNTQLIDSVLYENSPRSKIYWDLSQAIFSKGFDDYQVEILIFNDQNNPIFESNEVLLKAVKEQGQRSLVDSAFQFKPFSKLGYNYSYSVNLPEGRLAKKMVFLFKHHKYDIEEGTLSQNLWSASSSEKLTESYDVAKYIGEEKIYQKGLFPFPTKRKSLLPKSPPMDFSQVTSNGMDHLVYCVRNKTIVISRPQKGTFDFVSIVCVLTLIFGVVYLLSSGLKDPFLPSTLFAKIRASTLILVSTCLLVFCLGSIWYISLEWKRTTKDNLLKNQRSLILESEQVFGGFSKEDIRQESPRMEVDLQRLSKIYRCPIHLYDLNGNWLSSSHSEWFYRQLVPKQLSKQIQRNSAKGEVLKVDTLEGQVFLSVYAPIFNDKNQPIGIVHTPHFSYFNELKNQNNRFILSAIDAFVILLSLLMLVTLRISKNLISPLVKLHNWVETSNVDSRSHIVYDGQDEIGDVVVAYNRKLDELDAALQKIKANERELAWREMAQQVAHEIKNPLTPMKLTLQQILKTRSAGQSDDINLKISNVLNQIDSLAKIADDFSAFAKIPQPTLSEVNFKDILVQVASLYEHQVAIELNLYTGSSEIQIDKEQWIQVLNNLLTNAVQATFSREHPKVKIELTKSKQHLILTLSDNGTGIAPSDQDKIFAPYFTTKSGGSGIGLSVVKQILEKHGCDIGFESSESGTTFTISIPPNE